MHSVAPLGGLVLEHARVRQGEQQRARLQLPLPVAAHQLLHELQRRGTGQQQPGDLLVRLLSESQQLDEELSLVAISDDLGDIGRCRRRLGLPDMNVYCVSFRKQGGPVTHQVLLLVKDDEVSVALLEPNEHLRRGRCARQAGVALRGRERPHSDVQRRAQLPAAVRPRRGALADR